MSEQTVGKLKRSMHTPHFWICLILTGGEFWLIYMIFYASIPEANQRIGDIMIGTYSTAWLTSVAYWYQTTFGSNNKTELLAKTDAVKD